MNTPGKKALLALFALFFVGWLLDFSDAWPMLMLGAAWIGLNAVGLPLFKCRRCGFDFSNWVSGPTSGPLNSPIGPFPSHCPRCGPPLRNP